VIVLLPVVLAECVFVLESFYQLPRKSIAAALGTLVSSPGVEIDEPSLHADALDRFGKTNVHFVDCMIAATASAQRIPVATFDLDFRKFSDVRVDLT
jgi:predicted nucleic-acid-binding protein